MAEYKPQAVKDVPADDFIKAYAAHLKSTDKVVFRACRLMRAALRGGLVTQAGAAASVKPRNRRKQQQ